MVIELVLIRAAAALTDASNPKNFRIDLRIPGAASSISPWAFTTTSVVTDLHRLTSLHDVARIIDQFHRCYGERFGEGSQSPAAGVRINTLRVCSYVAIDAVQFSDIGPGRRTQPAPAPVATRRCHFVGHDAPLETPIYDERALAHGGGLEGPAVGTTPPTTYLVEPGWLYEAAAQRAVWLLRPPSNPGRGDGQRERHG